MFKKVKFLLIAVMTMLAAVVNAQVTTATLSGKIVADDDVVIGATIQATHIPSGTYYGTITNMDGRYTIQGMRAGGPYKIEISYVGYETKTFNDVSLKLGETTNISVALEAASEMLSELVVVGKGGIDATKTGAAMAFNADAIQSMPSISHGIADVTRMNPQVSVSQSGAMSFAGTNNRYNSFQVDGAMNNDNFGLTSNGSNGGQAGTQPISMETVEQIQVNVAPFDVRQSGFTGGAINAITKSGTNQFHGSAYGFGNNQSLIGSKYVLKDGKESEKYQKQSEYQAGFTIGGPIIKNKLFFFANYEKANKEYTNAYGLGAAASKVDAATAKEVLSYIQNLAKEQGVEYPANYQTADNYTKSDKAGIKLDWNINSRNNLSVRWSMVNAKQLNSTSGAAALVADTYTYDFASKTNTFIAELQSRINDTMNNELRASYVRVRDKRDPSFAFPMIEVSGVGNGKVDLGNERSSMANGLNQDIYTITDNFTWYIGNHTLTLGTHNELYKFSNLFIQDLYGTYYFASPDDLYAGKIKQFRYGHANVDVTGDPQWAAEFSAGQLGFYAQDKWNITDNFDLTYGLRMDIPLFLDAPADNRPFNDYAFSKGWNVKTNQKLSSSPMFSPRLGFRWNIGGDTRSVLRGGIGVFTGRVPYVWLSNNFSNTGIQLSTYNESKNTQNLSLILDPTKQGANEAKLSAGGSQTINVFDKDFRFAQNLRVNLGYDATIAGIDWTAEVVYSKVLNDVFYQQLAYDLNGSTLAQTYPSLSFDNRPMLSRVTSGTNFANIYKLSNTTKGHSMSASIQAKKSFNFGLDLSASYTYTESKAVNSGSSSVAQSNWAYNYTHGNPNAEELGNSAFNTPHTIKVSAFYNLKWNAGTTTIGLLYTGNSGSPYSIYYYGDLNGDSSNGNDLIFIPTKSQLDQMTFKDGKLNGQPFTADQQRAAMNSWIERDPYMSKHRGEYFERYGDNEAFESHFDFHLAHKFPWSKKNGQYVELSLDIMNVANMLNKKWGQFTSLGGSVYYSPITYSGNGEFQFLHDDQYDMRSYADYYSRWRGQLGLKFCF